MSRAWAGARIHESAVSNHARSAEGRDGRESAPPSRQAGGHRMNAAPIHIAGERLMLDPAGALVWPARRLLAVADLHFEKGSAFAATGRMLPPYDTRQTLQRLALVLRRWRPDRIVALGDSFHDAG